MDREQLIEDAAEAMFYANMPTYMNRDQWDALWPEGDTKAAYTALAKAALAVFEGAGSFLPVASDVQETTHTDDERIVQEFYAEHYGPASGWRVERLDLAVFVPTIKPGDVLDLVREVLIGAGLDIRAVPLHRTVQGERLCLAEHPITGRRCSEPVSPGHGHVCDLPPVQGEPSDAQSYNPDGKIIAATIDWVKRNYAWRPGEDDEYVGQIIEALQAARAALRAAAETGGER